MAGVVTTTTVNKRAVFGSLRFVTAKLAFDTGDYAAGGIAVTPAQFGLRSIITLIPEGCALDVAATPTGLLPRYVRTANAEETGGKIMLFEAAAAGASFTEKPAEAMGSGALLRVTVIGY